MAERVSSFTPEILAAAEIVDSRVPNLHSKYVSLREEALALKRQGNQTDALTKLKESKMYETELNRIISESTMTDEERMAARKANSQQRQENQKQMLDKMKEREASRAIKSQPQQSDLDLVMNTFLKFDTPMSDEEAMLLLEEEGAATQPMSTEKRQAIIAQREERKAREAKEREEKQAKLKQAQLERRSKRKDEQAETVLAFDTLELTFPVDGIDSYEQVKCELEEIDQRSRLQLGDDMSARRDGLERKKHLFEDEVENGVLDVQKYITTLTTYLGRLLNQFDACSDQLVKQRLLDVIKVVKEERTTLQEGLTETLDETPDAPVGYAE